MIMDGTTTLSTRLPRSAPVLEARGPMFRVAALVLIAACLAAAGFFFLRRSSSPLDATQLADPIPQELFQGWPRPDVALVLSGQQHGYLQPCGCTRPQYGGLARRYNFVRALRERGWAVVPVDLGDLAQKSSPQAMLKYVSSMKALRLMQYAGVGIGQNEVALDLADVLAEFALNNDEPRILAANLGNREQVDPADRVKPWVVAATAGGGPRVGVAGVVAPSVAQAAASGNVRFNPVEKVLPGVLEQLKAQKAALLVLLFQGSLEEAKACAAQFPQFHVMLCHCREDEPPGRPDRVGDTLIVRIGHKGRYVGVIGATRPRQAGQPFELRYEMVRLGEEFETPEGQDAKNPIHALLENYTKEVRDRKLLAAYPRSLHPLQADFPDARYVGSERCQRCHKSEYKVWQDSAHAHAYETLVKATRPSLRQYDGECVRCHVTGLEHNTGFKDEKATPHLLHVGCESCHGPGSLHVKDNYDEKINALMNPWKPKMGETEAEKQARLNRVDLFCVKCHDIDNDAHWDFKKKWSKIVHPMLR